MLVDTQKLVAPERFRLKLNVLTFRLKLNVLAHEPLMSMMKGGKNHTSFSFILICKPIIRMMFLKKIGLC